MAAGSGCAFQATIRKAPSNSPMTEGDALDPAISACRGHSQKRRAGGGKAYVARDAIEFADAGDAGEFGDQSSEGRQRQRGQRQARPAQAEFFANEFAKSAPRKHTEARRQLLHHVKRRYQRQDQRQQAILPLRPGLGRRHDIAGVGVGQHDQHARPHRREPAEHWLDPLALPRPVGLRVHSPAFMVPGGRLGQWFGARNKGLCARPRRRGVAGAKPKLSADGSGSRMGRLIRRRTICCS